MSFFLKSFRLNLLFCLFNYSNDLFCLLNYSNDFLLYLVVESLRFQVFNFFKFVEETMLGREMSMVNVSEQWDLNDGCMNLARMCSDTLVL